MKKRFIAILSTLMMIFALFSVASPNPVSAAAVVKCSNQSSQAWTTTSVPGGKKMNIIVAVKYQRCTNKLGPNFSRPTSIRATTDVSGSRMGCSNGRPVYNPTSLKGHLETRFSTYFSDARGRNFRLSKFSTPCSSNTKVTRLVKISKRVSVPLYYGGNKFSGTPPRVRVNYVVDWRGRGDSNGTVKLELK